MSDLCLHDSVSRGTDTGRMFWKCDSCDEHFVPDILVHEVREDGMKRLDDLARTMGELLWSFHERSMEQGQGPVLADPKPTDHVHRLNRTGVCEVKGCNWTPFLDAGGTP